MEVFLGLVIYQGETCYNHKCRETKQNCKILHEPDVVGLNGIPNLSMSTLGVLSVCMYIKDVLLNI